MSIGDAISYTILGFFVVVAIWLLWMFRQRMADQAEAQRIADAAFEAQILRSAMEGNVQSDFVKPLSTEEPMASAFMDDMPIPAAEPVPVRSRYAEAPQPDPFRQAADVTCASVISQMQNAGMIDQMDGYLELNGNAKGAVVVRLKGGKHAVVVPYFESEPFALRNLKRYDMIVQMGRDGKAVVLKSLEEVIAAKVSGSMH